MERRHARGRARVELPGRRHRPRHAAGPVQALRRPPRRRDRGRLDHGRGGLQPVVPLRPGRPDGGSQSPRRPHRRRSRRSGALSSAPRAACRASASTSPRSPATSDGATGGDDPPFLAGYDVANTDFFRDLNEDAHENNDRFDTIDPDEGALRRAVARLVRHDRPGRRGPARLHGRVQGPDSTHWRADRDFTFPNDEPTTPGQQSGGCTPAANNAEATDEHPFTIGPNDSNRSFTVDDRVGAARQRLGARGLPRRGRQARAGWLYRLQPAGHAGVAPDPAPAPGRIRDRRDQLRRRGSRRPVHRNGQVRGGAASTRKHLHRRSEGRLDERACAAGCRAAATSCSRTGRSRRSRS